MRPLLLALCVLLLVPMAFGQSDRGTITGTVSDPTNAIIPGVTIVAINTDNSLKYETITTETGNYSLAQLPAGAYQLTAELPGFKRYVRQGINVLVAQTLRIDISLEIGAATDEVTITADAPLLRTESSEVSHNVTSTRLDELPILGIGGVLSGSAGIRNPYAMVQLIPGATWTPNSLVRLNGTPGNTQSFRVEGQDASNSGTPGVPAQSQPGVDAIQEVAIQTSNFAAEYGQVGGGVFNVTMKSGSNQIHGTAFDIFVNEFLNSGNPFTNDPNTNPRPRARRNNYGFTVGGPIRRDKTFFFVSFEQFRETTIVNNQFQTIPTTAYRNGDFRTAIRNIVIGTDPLGRQMLEGMIYDPATTRAAADGRLFRDPFENNIIPRERFDPVAVKIQALFPPTSGPTADALTQNYIQPYDTSRVTEVPSVKIDQQLGQNAKVSFFWQRTKTSNPNGNTIFGQSDGLPDPLTTALGTFQNAPLYRLNYDHTLTPRLLLHLGAGYRSNYFFVPSVTRAGEPTNYNAETELGLMGSIETGFFPPMSTTIAANGTGGMKNFGSSAATNNITQSPTFNASLNWVKDNHSYKFGSEFRTEGYPPRVRGNTAGSYNFSAAQTGQPFQSAPVNGTNVGFAYASFLLGQVNSVSISNPTFPRMGKKQLGIYAQDTWKLTRKFTLDYGLRYDYSTYLREQYGRAPQFSPTTIHPIFGIPGAAIYDGYGPGRCNCDIARNYPWGFGPRLGAAYQITPKTVFRGGFGIVYSGTASNNNAAGGLAGSSATTNAPSFGLPVTTLSVGIPVSFRPAPWPSYDAGYFPTIPRNSPTSPPGQAPVWMDPNAGRPARQYQWSVGFQREVTQNLAVDFTYVGNRGVWWQAPAMLNLNANTPERLRSVGIDINSAADRALLLQGVGTPAVAARGFRIPYPGFPPNQTLAQALRPFPQFLNIPVYWNPMGSTWYDSLQIKATQRFTRGLTFSGNFSWSKALTIGTEIGEPNPGTTGNAVVNEVFDRQKNKYISRYDQPLFLNLALNYEIPRLSTNKIVSSVFSNWTLGIFAQYASGFPLQVPNAQTSLDSYLFQGPSFANRKPGVDPFTVELDCHCYDPNKTFVLNKDAWEDPAPGQFGTSAAYYSDYRAQRRPMENFNIGRTFRIREGMSFNIRAEFTNIFNRSYWSDPTGASLTNFKLVQTNFSNGNTQAGFGRVLTTGATAFGTTANLLPRQGSLVARFTF
jgi:hypothetical protein